MTRGTASRFSWELSTAEGRGPRGKSGFRAMTRQALNQAFRLSVLGCFLLSAGPDQTAGGLDLTSGSEPPSTHVEAAGPGSAGFRPVAALSVKEKFVFSLAQETGAGSARAVARPEDEKSSTDPKTSPLQSRRWTNSIGEEFIHIVPGEFTMGSTATQVDQLLKLFPDTKREQYEGSNLLTRCASPGRSSWPGTR
jgi:hypothetical protein